VGCGEVGRDGGVCAAEEVEEEEEGDLREGCAVLVEFAAGWVADACPFFG
jgi:hypothetical protein